MKKSYLLITLALLLSFSMHSIAQISQGGLPESFPKANLLKPVNYSTMESVNVAQLQAEDIMLDTLKSFPWRFGENLFVDLSPQNSGVWDTLNNGTKIWRLGISSAGALTINLTFDRYILPPGAKLFVYNSTKSEVIGAFTDFNNQADSIFATTLLRGDSIIIEYNEPENVAFPGQLHLWRVTHGYRSAVDYAKAFGGSGSCEINVACPTGVGWENQIRSVCMLVTGGSGFCTGSLINNTANDGTPYILTANHCYSAPGSWVFWFNWQSTTCTNPSSSPSYNSISGATLDARTTTSDFCLVTMSSIPPSNYNVYYEGWNRTTTPPTTGMGIHHPNGDIKKISPAGQFSAAGSVDEGNGAADCWQVNWSGLACTEPGSSGSPIYGADHLLVGQLYGGPSACGETTANMHDFYGRFCTSWTGDATNTTRLSNWLDPSSLNPNTLPGFDPNGPMAPIAAFSAAPTTTCTGVVQFTDASTGGPTGWAWNFGDGGTDTTQNPSHTYTTSGTFTVTLIVRNSVGDDTLIKTNYITINLPSAPTATGGSNCGTGTVTLNATGSGTVEWFSAATGGSPVHTGSPFTTPSLTTTTTYFVQDSVPGPSQYVGMVNDTTSGANYTQNIAQYEIFDCLSPVTLVSVEVVASTAGNRTISLQNSSGTTLQTTTVNVPAGRSRITLNFSVPVGTNLRLVGPTTPNLYRSNSGVAYPYTLAGLINITTSSASTNPTSYYYYFYKWEIKNSACISARTPVVATINTPSPVSLNIAANPTGAICSGTSVTFTATPTNGGTLPTYLWKKNGATITGATNATYSSSTLANNDVITCVLTSNGTCISGSPATSNSITMVVNNAAAAAVNIAANPAGAICAGTNVTFTATPVNGGTLPTYQWLKNGAVINGASSSTYSSSTLTNNSSISCVMTSNAGCVMGSPDTSSAVVMTVNAPATVSVSIAANPTGPQCSGTSITFSATPANGGTTPVYQWQVNGGNVGTNASTFSSSTLNNSDIVTCILTSNATCVTANPATSNAITTVISSALTAGVNIAASPSTTTCPGTNITFTATPVNGGSNPVYDWEVNGSSVGTNSPTYSSSTLNTGDVVSCQMTSNSSCATGSPATSNSLTITITSTLSASVIISANPGINICAGTSVTFTATPYNGGTPSYQWNVNGTNVGTNSDTYTTSTLANSDVISCVMTASESCATNNPATSNSLTVVLNPLLPSSVSIVQNPTGTVCSGTAVTFTATSVNGGINPVYQWQVNGVDVGSNSSVYVTSALNDGDVVNCQMTSSLSCVTANPAVSNDETASVTPGPVTPTITQNGDTLVSSAATGNQWYFENALGSFPVSGANGQTYLPIVTGSYYTIVTGGGCSSDSSNIIYVVITGINEFSTSSVLIYPNPVTNTLYVDFTGVLTGSTDIEIMNSLGQLVNKVSFENIAKDAVKEFNMSVFPKGIYFMRIKNEHLFHVEKLVID